MNKIIGLLVISGLLTAIAIMFEKNTVENHLQVEINQQLRDRNFVDLDVDMSGREAYVSGSFSESDVSEIEKIVSNIWGVGGVHISQSNSEAGKKGYSYVPSINNETSGIKTKLVHDSLPNVSSSDFSSDLNIPGVNASLPDDNSFSADTNDFSDGIRISDVYLEENDSKSKYRAEIDREIKTKVSQRVLSEGNQPNQYNQSDQSKMFYSDNVAGVSEHSDSSVIGLDNSKINQSKGALAPNEQKCLRAINLTNNVIYFSPSRTSLTGAAKQTLDGLLGRLKKCPAGVKLIIRGYVDNVGTYARNKIVKKYRSISVLKYLKSKGFYDAYIDSSTVNKTRASNATPLQRQENRRVEWVATY